MQKVLLQSTNTGIAPNSFIAPTVATKVLAAVITSSPCPTPSAFSDNLMASVPLLTPTAYFVPINSAKDFSNFLSSSPNVKSPVLTNSFNFCHRSSQSLNCCARYEYLTPSTLLRAILRCYFDRTSFIRFKLKYLESVNELYNRP